MSKQGMARPEYTHTKPKNDVQPVPEIKGKAKHAKAHAKPVIGDTSGTNLMVNHKAKGDGSVGKSKA